MKDLQVQLLRNLFSKPEEIIKFNINKDIFGDSITNCGIFDDILERYKMDIPVNIEGLLSIKNISPKRKKRLLEIKKLKYIPNTFELRNQIIEETNRTKWSFLFEEYKERLLEGEKFSKIYEEVVNKLTLETSMMDEDYQIDNIGDVAEEYLTSEVKLIQLPYEELDGAEMQPGEIMVIGGRPGMGKTMFGLDMALRQASEGYRVVFCSAEMLSHKLVNRLLSNIAEVKLQYIKKKTLTKVDFNKVKKAIEKFKKIKENFIIVSKSNNWESFKSAVKKHHLIKRVDFVYIDHLHYLKVPRGIEKIDFLGEVTSTGANYAKKMENNWIFLAQLSRECEKRDDKRPKMSDLRDSGSIEQDADIILFPYRPARYDTSEDPDLIEVIIEKNRDGHLFTSKMKCKLQYQKMVSKKPKPLTSDLPTESEIENDIEGIPF